MQVFDTWDEFYDTLNRVLPKFSDKPLFGLLQCEDATGRVARIGGQQ